ncbi:MAG: [Fe-Fe] hydrogenase large subunit C-terminal domain-containing protein [Spirochaetota bacterium]
MNNKTLQNQENNIRTFHSVQLDADLCVGCTTCIKFCPTKAIRVRDGKAKIFEDRCIDCGECIRRCPKGAKKAISDPLFILDGYDLKVALPAPSLYAQFGTRYSQSDIFAALHHMGFDEVFDVAWGAIVATEITRSILAKPGPAPRISSACPVIVRLIQQRFPSLIPNLMPILPPSEIAAREARKRLSEISRKIGIFFLSPCTAKVTAVRMPLGYSQSSIDAVISFSDIFLPLKRALEERKPLSPKKGFKSSVPQASSGHSPILPMMDNLEPGMGWARSDGELDALRIPDSVSVDGISNVIDLFEAIENGNIESIQYIEALACPGGCVGGPMAVENPHIARSNMRQRCQKDNLAAEASSSPMKAIKPPSPKLPKQEELPSYIWTEQVSPKPVLVLDADLSKALEMAEKIDTIHAQLPGIDCGACGAPDCDCLAEDIVRGFASIKDCRLLEHPYSKGTKENIHSEGLST